MHTPSPEIVGADLSAAREFLLTGRDEPSPPRPPRPDTPRPAGVPVRNGIARARMRPTARKNAP